MAKTKISEFSSTAADNTDITNINIAEGCSPANVNNAIRSLMSLLKNQQDGSSGDPFTVAGTLVASGQAVSSGTLNVTGAFQLDGTAGASGQVLLSAGGSTTPTWGNTFVTGMIMLWSGSSATIPSGWLLCDGSSSTPDLRNRFVVGATSTYAVGATGGSADAVVVSHTHTVTDSGHTHSYERTWTGNNSMFHTDNLTSIASGNPVDNLSTVSGAINSATTGITIQTTGSSGTNANLPPYYALCYIMKS
jgi:microcystin-dependent protein